MINSIYNVVGFFESKGENALALQILERLQKSAPQRTEPLAKLQALRMCKFGIIRNKAVGKPFDLTDTNLSGDAVSPTYFTGRPVLLVFYSPNNMNSKTLLRDLNNTLQFVKNTGVRVVAIQVEKPRNGNLDIGVNPEWVEIESNPEDDSELSEIFKRCPVTHVPYFALIDTDGVLSAINVPANYIKTRIEQIASQQ